MTSTRLPEPLPELLLPASLADVRLSEDAGGYYCAHVLYLANEMAPRAALLENACGEPLVGFLHVPRDAACQASAPVVPHMVRHAKTRSVVAAAVRGYVEDALERGAREPVRVLVTGFGPFKDVLSNPTGEFVSHPENVRASLALAFGATIDVAGAAVKVLEGTRAKLLRYRAAVPLEARRVALEVGFACLPVDDDAIDPARDDSLQGMLRIFRPHALLAMGVGREGPFRVEVRPDTRGLAVDGARPAHDPDRAQGVELRRNYALARAILRGGAALARKAA